MKKFLITLTVLFLTGSAFAYDLPEVIGVLKPHPPDSLYFGDMFLNIGDQNNDGCDELLANHNTFNSPVQGQMPYLNQVKLFYGAERMDDEPDLIFETDSMFKSLGSSIVYAGNLMPDREPFIVMGSMESHYGGDIEPDAAILFFEAGQELDNEPDIVMRKPDSIAIEMGLLQWNTRPTDVNGDGYHDLIAFETVQQRIEGNIVCPIIYFGGDDFDTIPDWRFHNRYNGVFQYSTGYDVNNDGYDDFLTREGFEQIQYNGSHYGYSLFLGGDPMDTIAAFEIGEYSYESARLKKRFCLLPDVNGDGFDDWVIHFFVDPTRDGYYLFYGSEEPDSEPDLILEGNHGLLNYDGCVCGGDFNNDGYGDIVTALWGGYRSRGEMHIHFGSRLMESEAQIHIDGGADYNREFRKLGEFLGAVGDYNGDGVDDFVTRVCGEEGFLVIFAGNKEWIVHVDEDTSPSDYSLSLDIYPNPFNEDVKLKYYITNRTPTELKVYDISGRCVFSKTESYDRVGEHICNLDGSNLTAGIYIVRFKSGKNLISRKMVYLP